MPRGGLKVLLFANTDWYLFNFRLPLAESLRDAGHEVVLVSPPGKYADLLVARGFRHVALPFSRQGINPAAEIATIARLRALYREEQPDLVHHFTIKCVLYGSIAARLAGRRNVVNAVPGLGHVFVDPGLRPFLLRPLVRMLYRFALRGTEVIFQNPDDRDSFLASGLLNRSSTHLIRGSGVNLARFRPAARAAERTEVRVLFAGRLLKSKGVAEYVEAAHLARAKVPGLQFFAAGEPDPGNPASCSAQTLQRWKQEADVQFVGHSDDMAGLIMGSDIAVLPSHGEGLPRFLLESAAAGLPLIAADVPGCREIVRHGVNGFLVPVRNARALADAILVLAGDPGLRARFGAESRRIAGAEFAQEEVVRRTFEVYRLALGGDARMGGKPAATPRNGDNA